MYPAKSPPKDDMVGPRGHVTVDAAGMEGLLQAWSCISQNVKTRVEKSRMS